MTNELSTSRRITATPEEIFDAFRNPARLARWWGPDGFTNTFHAFDFRVGGEWKFVMHSADGRNFTNESRFLEIFPPRRLLIDHISPPKFQLLVELTPEGTETLLSWKMTFAHEAECEAVKPIVIPANEQNLNRLEQELEAAP